MQLWNKLEKLNLFVCLLEMVCLSVLSARRTWRKQEQSIPTSFHRTLHNSNTPLNMEFFYCNASIFLVPPCTQTKDNYDLFFTFNVQVPMQKGINKAINEGRNFKIECLKTVVTSVIYSSCVLALKRFIHSLMHSSRTFTFDRCC
jgi:hypothetical protein